MVKHTEGRRINGYGSFTNYIYCNREGVNVTFLISLVNLIKYVKLSTDGEGVVENGQNL